MHNRNRSLRKKKIRLDKWSDDNGDNDENEVASFLGSERGYTPRISKKIPIKVRFKGWFRSSHIITMCKNIVNHIKIYSDTFLLIQDISAYKLIVTRFAYIMCFVSVVLVIGLNMWALALETNVVFTKQTFGDYFWIVRSINLSSIVLLLIVVFFLSRIYIRQDYSLPFKIGAAVTVFIIHICTTMLYILQRFNTNIIVNPRARILYNLLFTQVVITYTTIFFILTLYSMIVLMNK